MGESGHVIAEHLGIQPDRSEIAVVRLLLEIAVQVVEADEGSLLVVDRSQSPPRELVFALTVGSRDSERALVGQRVPIGEGITGLAARTHDVQIGAPLYDGIEQARRGEAPAGDPSSVLAAPLLIDDEVAGVMTAVTFDPRHRFRQAQASLYSGAAAVAALLLDQLSRLAALEVGDGEPEVLQRQVIDAAERLARRGEGLVDVARLMTALERLSTERR